MTWRTLLSMDGYGFYVWSAYVLTMGALGGELLLLARRRRRSGRTEPREEP